MEKGAERESVIPECMGQGHQLTTTASCGRAEKYIHGTSQPEWFGGYNEEANKTELVSVNK